jgi:hypothetical protein
MRSSRSHFSRVFVFCRRFILLTTVHEFMRRKHAFIAIVACCLFLLITLSVSHRTALRVGGKVEDALAELNVQWPPNRRPLHPPRGGNTFRTENFTWGMVAEALKPIRNTISQRAGFGQPIGKLIPTAEMALSRM